MLLAGPCSGVSGGRSPYGRRSPGLVRRRSLRMPGTGRSGCSAWASDVMDGAAVPGAGKLASPRRASIIWLTRSRAVSARYHQQITARTTMARNTRAPSAGMPSRASRATGSAPAAVRPACLSMSAARITVPPCAAVGPAAPPAGAAWREHHPGTPTVMPMRPLAGGARQRADDRRGGHTGHRLAGDRDDHADEEKDEPSHPVRRCWGHGLSFAGRNTIRQP